MKDNIIKIVTAGAGSGKTYRLATEVLQAIQQKKTRPEGILLTTFTRKAAAELEERVRVRLLEQGAWEEAQRIRQAWIGTIDSVCLRIIQEYAFEAGQSPEIAVFGAGEDLIEFNRALTDSVTDEEFEQLESLSKSLRLRIYTIASRLALYRQKRSQTRREPIASMRKSLTEFAERSIGGYVRLFPKPIASEAKLDQELLDQLNSACTALEKNVGNAVDTTQKTQQSPADHPPAQRTTHFKRWPFLGRLGEPREVGCRRQKASPRWSVSMPRRRGMANTLASMLKSALLPSLYLRSRVLA